MKDKNKMNPRQWKLYEFLKEQNEFISIKEIMNKLGLWDNRRLLTRDLQVIKENPTINRILITNRKGIKFASTEQEANIYLEKEKIEILSRFKRYFKQAKQIQLDNQTQIVWNSEKDTIEVFKKWQIKNYCKNI